MCTRVCKWNAFLRFFHGKHADGVESRKRAITMFAAENSQWKRTCSAVVEIVRSRARFTQLTNHYGGGLGISVCSLENERVSRAMARGRNCEFGQRRMSVYQQQDVDSIE